MMKQYRKAEGVIEREINKKGILLIKGKEHYFIKGIGVVVWKALHKERNIKEIIITLLKTTKNPPPIDIVEKDINEFLDNLKEAGLIVSVEEKKACQ